MTDRKIYFNGIRTDLKKGFVPVQINKKGWKIGFFSVTGHQNVYSKYPYANIVNYNKEENVRKFLEYIRRISKEFDLFIVSFHGGVEYKIEPSKVKADFYEKLVYAGAHIVYGHHPHVLQPFKTIAVNGQTRLIIYSAGNFISGQRWSSGKNPYPVNSKYARTGDSFILQVRLEFRKNGPTCVKIDPVLITNHINSDRQIIIEKYDSIIKKPFEKKWLEFYKERYKILNEFLKLSDILTDVEEEKFPFYLFWRFQL